MSLPLREAPPVQCSSCDADLLHCHGTAIVDVHGSSVCSDDQDCELSADEHWFVHSDDDVLS